jgi:hypothetical protein
LAWSPTARFWRKWAIDFDQLSNAYSTLAAIPSISSWLPKYKHRLVFKLRSIHNHNVSRIVRFALRRPEDYSPEQGARFEVHFEKLRNRVEGDGAAPFEAKLESFVTDQGEGVRWSSRERSPPVLKQVAELFQDGLTVREVAAALKMSKTEAGRLRLRAMGEGLLAAGHGGDRLGTNGHNPASWVSANQHSPTQG